MLVFIFGCGPDSRQPVDKDQLSEKEVLDFISEYDKSWQSRDTTRMKELMDEKYVYFSSTGNIRDRSAIISWFTPADKYKVDSARRSEILVVQIKGNTAIISTRWIGSGTFGEEKFDDDQRCGLVLQKEDGKMKLLSEHCTQIVK